MDKKTTYIIIALLILLIGGYFLLSYGNRATAPTQNETTNTDITNTPTSTEEEVPTSESNFPTVLDNTADAVVLSTQRSGDDSVTVDNLNLTKPGFIVLYSGNTVIGSSGLLSSGLKQDLSVNLKSGTTLSERSSYTAKVYWDDGDKKFDASKDTLSTSTKASANFIAQ